MQKYWATTITAILVPRKPYSKILTNSYKSLPLCPFFFFSPKTELQDQLSKSNLTLFPGCKLQIHGLDWAHRDILTCNALFVWFFKLPCLSGFYIWDFSDWYFHFGIFTGKFIFPDFTEKKGCSLGNTDLDSLQLQLLELSGGCPEGVYSPLPQGPPAPTMICFLQYIF